jgi:hypothetical protein
MMKGRLMNSQAIPAGELVYEAEIKFTNIVEYGVSMEALSLGKIPPPLEGARFDQSFQGVLHGPKLRGRISGIDHLYVRADGRFQLHIHAQINTDDGHYISFSSDGVSRQNEGNHETQLRAAVSLFTSSPAYRWLNNLQVWALGTLDPEKGEAFIKAYAA